MTEIETVSELKPCPFCNGTRGHAKLEQLQTGKWRVICYADLIMTAEHDSEAEAIRYWNRRSLDTADGVEPDVVAALDKASELANLMVAQGARKQIGALYSQAVTLGHMAAHAKTILASRTRNTEVAGHWSDDKTYEEAPALASPPSPLLVRDLSAAVAVGARAIYSDGPSIGGDNENGWDAQSESYKHKARAVAHVVILSALDQLGKEGRE